MKTLTSDSAWAICAFILMALLSLTSCSKTNVAKKPTVEKHSIVLQVIATNIDGGTTQSMKASGTIYY